MRFSGGFAFALALALCPLSANAFSLPTSKKQNISTRKDSIRSEAVTHDPSPTPLASDATLFVEHTVPVHDSIILNAATELSVSQASDTSSSAASSNKRWLNDWRAYSGIAAIGTVVVSSALIAAFWWSGCVTSSVSGSAAMLPLSEGTGAGTVAAMGFPFLFLGGAGGKKSARSRASLGITLCSFITHMVTSVQEFVVSKAPDSCQSVSDFLRNDCLSEFVATRVVPSALDAFRKMALMEFWRRAWKRIYGWTMPLLWVPDVTSKEQYASCDQYVPQGVCDVGNFVVKGSQRLFEKGLEQKAQKFVMGTLEDPMAALNDLSAAVYNGVESSIQWLLGSHVSYFGMDAGKAVNPQLQPQPNLWCIN